jgi:hypothetical protein
MMRNLRNTNSAQIALLIGMLIIFAGMLAMSQHLQRPNNGDGWRILRSAQIAAPQNYYAHQPFPRFYDFKDLRNIKPVDLIPMSSTAAIVETISFVERAATLKKFDFLWVTACYLALYLLGILLIILNIRVALAIPFLLILVNPYILAFFNSPYEESLFIALCPLLSFLFIKTAQPGGLAIRTIALVIASIKVQFVPAFLFGIKNLKLRSNIIYLLLSVLVISAVVMKASKFNESNSYNRYYNGLAFSMSGVSSWPVHDFEARREIAGEMTTRNVIFPSNAEEAKKYWGSSFWPTGDNLDVPEQKFVMSQVGKWFWQTIRANPNYAYRLVSEPMITMAKSDYRMNYIFGTDIDNRWLDIHALIMQDFGVIFLLASICSAAIAIRNRNARHLLFILITLLYPLLVVYGDGYYEYEKHLFPVLFLGVVFSLSLSFMSMFAKSHQEILPSGLHQYAGNRRQENAI